MRRANARPPGTRRQTSTPPAFLLDLDQRSNDLICTYGGVAAVGSEAMYLSEVDCRSTATITAFARRQRLEASRAMAGATNVETEWVYVPDDAVID